MKITILDGTEEKDSTAISILKIFDNTVMDNKWSLNSYTLRDIEIDHCKGDFFCWVKTPGKCINSESSQKISEACIQCDLMVFLTPVTFGGYSFQLKKALDHLIQNISPYFKKVNGETHHQKRYSEYPSLLVLGTLPEADLENEKIFKKLVYRNSINFYPKKYSSTIFYNNQNMEEISKQISVSLGEVGAN
jgi:multimeric flavodoxin WrbA